jgi:succinoglycan biosynthesis transport protein ExoP
VPEEIELIPDSEIDLNEILNRAARTIVRRRWWVVLPVFVSTFGTLFILSSTPNRYTSKATLLVVQQQIPQRYVLPTTTTDLREALQATTQEVLSRTRLLQIIDEFGLYSEERKHLSPEEVLDVMRQDIQIQPVENQHPQRDVNSFEISFIATKPQLAQEVTSKLTSLLIEQNLVTREHQAATTTNFLQDQREAARVRLADAEEQVRSFKMQHLGELPEQQAGNLAILAGLQSQLQNTMSALSRAQEQREYLDSLIEYRALAIDGELTRLKAQRAKLMSQYTPQYPTVVKIEQKIAETEVLLKTIRDVPPPGDVKKVLEPTRAPLGGDQDISLLQLRSQISANRLEIENLTEDEQKLKSEIEQYQGRLNQTPIREQQLAGVVRNYDQLKQDYADLLNKEMQSQLAADLEKRQEGQQFRVIDQPSLPTVPSSPNRVKFGLGGLGVGILIGLALAFLMEFMDHSFRSETDLATRLHLPFVVAVPPISTPAEKRSALLTMSCEWILGTALAMFVLAIEFYEFYLYRHG